MPAILITCAACLTAAGAQEARSGTAGTLVQDIQPGALVKMDLSAGTYRLRGASQDGKVHVRWTSDDPEDVKVRMEARDGEVRLRAKGPDKNFHVDIDLPPRTDLAIHLSVGDLSVRGIEGNKDISCHIGDLRIDVGDGQSYKDLEASVKIGEITGLGENHGGFFRSLDRRGPGPYHLRAQLGIGDIQFAKGN
jgi:hypothetical protein